MHGSIDSPDNMVVTSDDYFHFINSESYFSRKLSTILHENTVVILGYSLSDTNLKAIISDYKGLSFKQIVSGNIFLVSRNAVSQYVKDYYSHCYGMRVIDGTEIADFFKGVSASVVDAEKCKDATVNLRNVLNNGFHYTDDYIKISSSLYEIIAAVGAIGKSVNDQKVVSVLADIIEKKRAFTQGIGAWDQYVHLARWLVYIAGIVDIASLTIKDKYLASALHSMNTMSKSLTKGYSWHAYDVWDAGWSNISSANRAIIATHIRATCMNADALGVVNRP